MVINIIGIVLCILMVAVLYSIRRTTSTHREANTTDVGTGETVERGQRVVEETVKRDQQAVDTAASSAKTISQIIDDIRRGSINSDSNNCDNNQQ